MTTDVLASVALGCLAIYVAIAFAARSILQRRRTGSTGWVGVGGRRGSAEWWAGVLIVLGAVGVVSLPVVALLVPASTTPGGLPRLGVALGTFALGLALTIYAQLAMGDSWRIGVRHGERTQLRTDGPFAWCRNPIFTGSLLAVAGIAILVPWTAAAWLALVVGIELQVRCVEEPHLHSILGDTYQHYAARTGRFLPHLGRSLARPR